VTWRVSRLVIDIPGFEVLAAAIETARQKEQAPPPLQSRPAADLVAEGDQLVADWRDDTRRNSVNLDAVLKLRHQIGNLDADDPLSDRAIAIMGELALIRDTLVSQHQARQKASKSKSAPPMKPSR
jgi:hypothetical protein